MKKSTIALMLAFAFLGGIIFTTSSCKKSRLNKETVTDEDNSLAESTFDDIDKTASEVAVKEEGVKQRLDATESPAFTFGSACASVYHFGKNNDTLATRINDVVTIVDTPGIFDSTNFPRTFIIDFGTSGCVGEDGRTRKGIIKVLLTGKWWAVGTAVTHTLENYYVNNHKVEGMRKVTHSSATVWNVSVTDARITDPNGKTVSWASERTRTMVAGDGTKFNIFDDVYTISGTAQGTNRDGRNFTVTITTPLRLQACNWVAEITSGIVEIQPEDLKLRTVDFGDGTCDNEGTVTVGNKTKTFVLRK